MLGDYGARYEVCILVFLTFAVIRSLSLRAPQESTAELAAVVFEFVNGSYKSLCCYCDTALSVLSAVSAVAAV